MPKCTESDLTAALESVRSGRSVNAASRLWGVPRSTLRHRISGFPSKAKYAASSQRLSPLQEKHLTDWVLAQRALGFPPTHAQVREFASRVLGSSGDHRPLGKNWTEGFVQRNPALKPSKGPRIEQEPLGATPEA